jgi:transposase
MPRPLQQEIRDGIKLRLTEGGMSHLAIADEAGVSLQTVKNYSSNLATYGSILPPSVSRRGRPPLLTREMVDVCYFALVKARANSLSH